MPPKSKKPVKGKPVKTRRGEDGIRRPVEPAPATTAAPREPKTTKTVVNTAVQVADQITELRKALKQNYRPSLAVRRWFSTGNLVLDLAVNQGLPGGRLVELSGPEGCGKSTLALEVIREAQAQGGRGDYFDLEAGATCGLVEDMARVSTDPKHWELWRPETAEAALTAIDKMIPIVGSMDAPAVIVLDSVPAIVPQYEYDTPYGDDPRLAGISRYLGRFCRNNMTKLARYHNVLIIFINHVTTPFKASPFEKPQYSTPGGRPMKYFNSVRLRFDKKGSTDTVTVDTKTTDKALPKNTSKVVARERMHLVVWKNRFGSGHREITIPLNYVNERSTATTKGFDDARSVLEFLRDEGVLINAKTDAGAATAYWCLAGLPDTKRTWKQWVLGYNTDPTLRDQLCDVTAATASTKWAPDEGAYEMEGEDIDILASLPAHG